ncbi:DUF742 domain-containing protein [Microbispora sp. ATCC PTA-5024]|uniref:DUF742 domain-containing protein n=1 Tax=Microbispora sp. ATCC PTA-5024 TaxID=316330 RepID=UPI0003DC09E8|nr:DUF742 domain-containing protein [Microbispora sp. ATCC PTA-5024]ETK34659.1 hypothetical protein MPTA5024_17990 [Microbispora sp. ATCC PTA-5024]
MSGRDDEEWVDDLPVVRSYALTRGRARPTSAAALDLTALVGATGREIAYDGRLGIEHRRLLDLLPGPRTLADLASDARLPLGVVRVLLGDLIDHGVAAVRPAARRSPMEDLLREVITGLRAL